MRNGKEKCGGWVGWVENEVGAVGKAQDYMNSRKGGVNIQKIEVNAGSNNDGESLAKAIVIELQKALAQAAFA